MKTKTAWLFMCIALTAFAYVIHIEHFLANFMRRQKLNTPLLPLRSTNGTEENIQTTHIPIAKTGNLLPRAIAESIPFRIRERFDSLDVANVCNFEHMRLKRKAAQMQGSGHARYVVYDCSGSNKRKCGGLGDRMKGIFSGFLHAMAIGYEFLVRWDLPVDLEPDILVASAWVNWSAPWPVPGNKLPVRMMDTGNAPFRLCTWLSHDVIVLLTNGSPLPRGNKDCETTVPYIYDLLLNQTSTRSCIESTRGAWRGGAQCMGCIWWYLFRIGQTHPCR